ncbi:phage tail tape measure protein [Streptacidiphilus sp. N1-12]|uniref:Phage tail tape measure protein n=2 Tax=Streptacidiphilus alkalitolerans TaxID=3342712 RepID=A0ABV6V9W0_9ACTN
MGALPPVFIEFLGSSRGVKAAIKDVKAELAGADAESQGTFARAGMIGKAAIAGIGLAAADAAVHTVHMAADFETQMTRVRTGAGELAGNMRMVGDGVLTMSGQVGESTTDLTSGLYTVESASFHGADALTVLKNSAMGAKVGAADLATVTDAVTTGLNAYHMGASQAATVTNELIATESEGKTNMEALAGSMASILPTASAAHVGIQEVLGAMATMTAQGTPAAVAATYLRQTIGMLSNPSAKAASEMKDLGLNSVQVAQNLGKRGLASTLTELTDAIQKKMGPAGTVLIKHLQDAAKNTTAYQKVLAKLPPAQQTYIGALATMVGGTKSMQAALELTGPHMATFQANTKGIANHVKDAHGQIEGWADVQKTFNQRMAEAKASTQAMGIQIGNQLLPVVTKLAGYLATGVTWLTRHKSIAEALAIVIGGALVVALTMMTAALWAAAAASTAVTWPIVLIGLAVAAVIAVIVLLIMHWREVWSVIKTVALAIGKAVADAWDWVASKTAAVWGDITSAVARAWSSVADFFVGAWHDVADPIVGAWQTITRVTSEVWDSIIGFFKRWWPLLLVIFAPPIALLLAIWNHFHTQIIGTAVQVWNRIKGFFQTVWAGIKQDAGAAWGLIQTYIVAPVTATWHELVRIWGVVSGWLSSQWHAISASAALAWAHVKSAIIDPITSAWDDLVGLMRKIEDTIGSAVSGAWHTVEGFMSHWYQVGIDIIKGIIKGVTGSAGGLMSSMKGIAEGALNSAKSFLGISSPSKKFAEIGMYINSGLVQGLEGSASQVQAATRKISNLLYEQFGADSHVGLQNLVKLDGQDLNRLAGQRTAVAARLKTANSQLATLQKDWASTQAQVAGSIMQSVSVVMAGPDNGGALTTDQVIANMQAQVTKAQAFAAELQTLHKNGLSADMIQQIAAAGVDQGGATAQALASATKGQLQQINALQTSAKTAAGSVGTAVANSMYSSGIASAQGLVKGLQSQEAAIQRQMNKIATQMADTIKHALKIHSPSQIFSEIGDFVAQGLGAGIESGTHHAVTAATALAGAVTAAGVPALPRLGALTPAGATGAGGQAAQMAQVTTNVYLDDDLLFSAMQERALLFDRRNSKPGMVYVRG